MRSIGGFFSLELPHNTGGELYPKAIRLNSGRSCFEYILKARGYKKVWLPKPSDSIVGVHVLSIY